MATYEPKFKPGDRALVIGMRKLDGERCRITSEASIPDLTPRGKEEIHYGYEVEMERAFPDADGKPSRFALLLEPNLKPLA